MIAKKDDEIEKLGDELAALQKQLVSLLSWN